MSAASIVDVDLRTNKVTAQGPDHSAGTTPGSTLKPIVLLLALRAGVIAPSTRLACTGSLHVAGRNLACSHPASIVDLDAREALAYSCNSYVSRVARQMPEQVLKTGMRPFGIDLLDSVAAPQQRVLFALGLAHVRVSPLQLAHAYVVLAHALQADDPAATAVSSGLADSVVYGMARMAQTPGLTVLGKTGTAHDASPELQHGWFAGIVSSGSTAPPAHMERVLVVYAPGGSGNDAAAAAHHYLLGSR